MGWGGLKGGLKGELEGLLESDREGINCAFTSKHAFVSNWIHGSGVKVTMCILRVKVKRYILRVKVKRYILRVKVKRYILRVKVKRYIFKKGLRLLRGIY